MLIHLSEYGCKFLWERKPAAQREVERVVGPSSVANYVTHLFIYILGTTNAVSSSGVVVTRTLERILFLDLGLPVTEIN